MESCDKNYIYFSKNEIFFCKGNENEGGPKIIKRVDPLAYIST